MLGYIGRTVAMYTWAEQFIKTKNVVCIDAKVKLILSYIKNHFSDRFSLAAAGFTSCVYFLYEFIYQRLTMISLAITMVTSLQCILAIKIAINYIHLFICIL